MFPLERLVHQKQHQPAYNPAYSNGVRLARLEVQAYYTPL